MACSIIVEHISINSVLVIVDYMLRHLQTNSFVFNAAISAQYLHYTVYIVCECRLHFKTSANYEL